jgi:hypothetical protein
VVPIAGTAAVAGDDGVSWGAQQTTQAGVRLGSEDESAAAAAAAAAVSVEDALALYSSSGPWHNSSGSGSNPNHHGIGKVILQFSFWVQELQPCSTSELKTLGPDAGLNPTPQQLVRNKLLLQLTEGLYTLTPRPQSPNPESAPQLSPMPSGEEWVGAEGFDSLRLGLGRHLSGPLATVAQQQQLYR